MQKTEWPDAEKLKELRQAGIFPFSRLCLSSVTSIALLCLTYFLLPDFKILFSLLSGILAEPVTNFTAVQFGTIEILDKFKFIILCYLFVYLLVSILTILFQSKFYFSLINFAFNPSQIVRVSRASGTFLMVTLIRGFFGITLGLIIGGSLFYWVYGQFMQIIYSDKFYKMDPDGLELLLPILKSALIFSVLVLSVLSVLSYLAVRFGFMLRHRTGDRFGENH